jgi:predicted aspartyl protease
MFGLWDTGSTNTSISKGLARHLGLKSIDMCNVSGVMGIHPSVVYQIDILLPSNVGISDVRVAEFQDNGAFEILIGMDIIDLGDFAISNNGGKSIVSFRIPPSDCVIDFVREINKTRIN